eukprot:TRINITY_DN14167_c0_g1_i2.p1 TRINITY_DN14167_c0_g1~~TRINITY_DN14167_c0_g1_i2.p1  ORF type:complete len:260 (+),score=53.59 TRINITY_DN14167_c0_g1_i2:82-861(+)
MSFCLEFVSDEETHRVDYAKTPSYDAVAATIGDLHGGHKAFVKYVDEDGDLCTLCVDTFEDFLTTARENSLPGDDVSARLLVMQANPCDVSDADLLEAWEHCEVEEFVGIDEEFQWVGEEEVSADSQEKLEEHSGEVGHEPYHLQTPSETEDFKSEGPVPDANALELTSESDANNVNAQRLCSESLEDAGPDSAEEKDNDEEQSSRLCPRTGQCPEAYIFMSPLARFAGTLLTVPLLCSAPDAWYGRRHRSAGLRPLIG